MNSTSDFTTEEKFPLSQIRAKCSDLKNISLKTLHRWVTRGVKGRKLESRKLGGRHATSVEAIGRFLNHANDIPTSSTVRSPNQRQKASEAAARELEQAGC